MQKLPTTRALYNSDCPLCNSEMCAYDAYSQTQGLAIAFEDLNATDLARWGLSEDDATRLLHVIHHDGLHIGFDAILVLWEQMPRFRIWARMLRLPGIYQIFDWLYANVLARLIYRRHQKRKARGLVGAR